VLAVLFAVAAKEKKTHAVAKQERPALSCWGLVPLHNAAMCSVSARALPLKPTHPPLPVCLPAPLPARLQTDHKCVLDSCRYLQQRGFYVTYLPVQQNGLVDMQQLADAIRPDTSLVSALLALCRVAVWGDVWRARCAAWLAGCAGRLLSCSSARARTALPACTAGVGDGGQQ
jgi:hypothetical protein